MKKIYGILLIFIVLFSFICYVKYSENFIRVIKINTPNSIVLDNDKSINLDLCVLSFKNKELCNEVSKKLGLSYDDLLAVGYLADKFAEDNLLGKPIVIEDYKNKLLKSGFVIKNGLPVNDEQFKAELKYARKQNFVIYNLKSKKYHKLSCKYGAMAHNVVIIPKRNLSDGAVPCRFCLDNKKNIKPEKTKVSKILKPSLVLKIPYIKILFSDYTTNLKVSNECKSDICKEILTQINSSQQTIDMAIYGYEHVPAIEFALSNAMKRGVRIRLVYDRDLNGKNIYSDTDFISKFIPNSVSDLDNSIMHDKFYIFDSKRVITGSANLSCTDMSGFNSNSAVLIDSPSVAKIYQQEFEQMYNGNFHNTKSGINKQDIILGKSVLSIYFSPKDDVTHKKVIPLINSAKSYIYMPVFLITDKDITTALISAKKRGVDVKVIVDAVNAKGKASKHQILRNNGILVKTENYAGKLHSKSIIIDDKYVVIGSMNFSYSGNYKNDENLIVIKNREVAVFYRKFFEYLWRKIYNFWLTHDVSAESIYSIGSCSDGIDNDFDGKIDSEDEGCKNLVKTK